MGRKREGRTLEVVYPDCAGIDIGKSKHYVAVDPARTDQPVRAFESFTEDLERMAEWLRDCEVKVVALESTGVYWIPAYEVLERAGFELHLVNPRSTKQISGRKSDVLDCQWLRQLMSYGLLKGAFRPSDEICVLRAYVRQRARLTRDAARATQQIQKALTEMNVQLDSVISDIMGKTGQAILRAIVDGERDGRMLAKLRDRRIKADEDRIARSLRGNWREEHLFALRQALQRWDWFQEQIRECDEQIMKMLEALGDDRVEDQPLAKPARSAQERALQHALRKVLGVDLTAIPTIGVETALTLAAEVGPDLSRFPSMEHFTSWLTLAPGTQISGDKRLSGRGPKRFNRAGQALRLAASSARRSDSYIGAIHRSRLARWDSARAIKATAHQLARMIYAMLTRGEAYVERSIADFEEERRQRRLRTLQRNARRLGFRLEKSEEKSAA